MDDDARQDLVRDARRLIYGKGYAVTSERVEALLFPTSLVPTEVRAPHQQCHHTLTDFEIFPIQNAFSRLNRFGFDVFSSLVVDLMHEFELGVWKTLFIHLIRILEAADGFSSQKMPLVSELDRRYGSKQVLNSEIYTLLGTA
jgi:hypothetical protein